MFVFPRDRLSAHLVEATLRAAMKPVLEVIVDKIMLIEFIYANL